MANGVVTLKLDIGPSEEREALAKFVKYAFDHSWVIDDIISAIRSGEYLLVLIQETVDNKNE